MQFTTLLILVMVIYFGTMIAISIYGKKKAQSFDTYLDAGKSCGVLMLIGAQVGSHIGNGLVVGGAASGAEVGIGGALYGVACGLACLVVAFFCANWVSSHGYRSACEYFRDRYQSDALAVIFILANCFGCIGLIGSQLIAGKALFEALDMNGTVGVFVIALVVLIYAQISGIWGSFATSIIQVAIILVAVLFCGVYLAANGGVSEITLAVAEGRMPESFLHFTQAYTLPVVLMSTLPMWLASPIDTSAWQRVNSAKDRKTVVVSHVISCVLVAGFAFIPVFMGMYANAKFGATGNSAFFVIVQNILPPALAAITLVAVIAAVMSTIDALYITVAQLSLNDFYAAYINRNASEEKLRKLTLPLNIFITACACVFALSYDNIISLLCNAQMFVSAACLVPFLGGLLWKKATKQGAAVCGAIGLILETLEITGIYALPYSAITVMLPGLVCYVVISLLTQPKTASV